jgi:hypothetical protein
VPREGKADCGLISALLIVTVGLAVLRHQKERDMTDLHYECSDQGDGTSLFTWHWSDVPTDDRAPGLDNYFVRVVVDVPPHHETLIEIEGAEDNAWGEPYTITVPNDTPLYVQVINDAQAFWFEYDIVVSCPTPEAPNVLPYTGMTDWLLPLAIILVGAGTGLLRLFGRD